MSKTKINITAVSGATASAKSAKNSTVNVGNAVTNIRWRTDSKILGRNGISSSFTNIQNSISQIATDIEKIYQFADNAALQYQQTENKIVQDGSNISGVETKSKFEPSANRKDYEALFKNAGLKVLEAGTSIGLVSGETENGETAEELEEKSGWKDSAQELIFDLLGEAGVVGKSIDGVADLIDGLKSGDKTKAGKATVGIFKPTVSIFGDLAEEAFKDASKQDWKSVVIGQWKPGSALEKLEEIGNAYPQSTKFGAAFWDDLSSFTFKNADTVGDKIKVGAKWAGTALSAITNGIDNHADYKAGEMSAGRAVAETVMETVVDVGIGAVSTAAASVVVGAAATALGVAAPAIAIGAVAVGITWAADSVTKWATKEFGGEEKGLTEFVSDVVLDTVEGAGNLLQKAGSGLKNAIGGIGTKWRACFG